MKRYDEFVRHLSILRQAREQDLTNTFIVSGIIDKFFIQFELGWKLLKELLREEGRSIAAYRAIHPPRGSQSRGMPP